MRLAGKTALITGAGSGIGQAAALLLAREGAQVALLDRTEEQMAETLAEIQQSGKTAVCVAADVSQAEAMERAITEVCETWGRMDIVFANAGINGVWTSLEELRPEEWDETLNVNLRGTFLTVKYALPYIKKEGGSVIITSSVNGTRMFSNTGATAYSCSKAAQVAFMKMAALELAKYRIRVNAVCPGAIETNIGESTKKHDLERIKEPVIYPKGSIPLTKGQPGDADQVAELVLFLASDAASHITGTEIWIDGGQSLMQG